MKKQIANVLANRYASAELVDLWSAETKIILERQLWIAVLKAQRDLGVDVPAEAIAAYENVIDKVDLESIANREKITRHDVKARIEEFNALAGYEQVHKGMTSRDLTENVEPIPRAHPHQGHHRGPADRRTRRRIRHPGHGWALP